MLYQFYEWSRSALTPFRMAADATRLFYQNPLNPLSRTTAGRTIAAAAEVFERSTRVYGKPEFGLHETVVHGMRVPVQDRVVWEKPFGRLLFFDREVPKTHKRDPRFLVVAPLSGHHATLLRGTVEALLPDADVYITDWTDARDVPVSAGKFDLEDYTDYLVEMLHFLGPDTHVIGVCQPTVPVLMAVARMEEDGDDCSPPTMTLMGGPIDTRVNSTEVTELAETKGIDWFRDNLVMPVPFPHAGVGRMVYPGFLQLTGFKSMNLDRHMIADKDFFWDLVKDDGDSAEKHRTFYDEYNAVLDMTAEFYLQTVEEVFVKHSLPKGEMMYHGRPIDLKKIRRTALLTIEGENDDISGVGQTEAAQKLCVNIPGDMRIHYVQPKVGHYGVFNGSRFRAEICPRIVDFALTHGTTHAQANLPKRPETMTGDSAYRKFGAYAERDAKAKTLGRGRASAGETVLAGAMVPDSARALRAMNETAQAMMKTAFGKTKPLGKHLSENPADDRDLDVPAETKAPAAPASATPKASVAANAPIPDAAPVSSSGSKAVANSNVKAKPAKPSAPVASDGAKAAASAAKSTANEAGSGLKAPAKPTGSVKSTKAATARTARKTTPAKAGPQTTRRPASAGKRASMPAKTAAPAARPVSQAAKTPAEVANLKPASSSNTSKAEASKAVTAKVAPTAPAADSKSVTPKIEAADAVARPGGPVQTGAPIAAKAEAPAGKTASGLAVQPKSAASAAAEPAVKSDAIGHAEPVNAAGPVDIKPDLVGAPEAAGNAAPARPSSANPPQEGQVPSRTAPAKAAEPFTATVMPATSASGKSADHSEPARPSVTVKAAPTAVDKTPGGTAEQPQRGRPNRQARRAQRAAAKPGQPRGRR